MNISRLKLVVLMASMLLIFSACGGKTQAPAASTPATTTKAPVQVTAPSAPQKAATSAAAPQANQSNTNAECTAIYKANTGFGMALAAMVNLTADTDYSAYTDPASPF